MLPQDAAGPGGVHHEAMADHEEHTLDLDDDPAFLERERRVGRLGWVVLSLFVLAGLAGLLGPGPLSSTTSGTDADPVRISYDRVVHLDSADRLTLLLDTSTAEGDSLSVELTGSWLGGVDLETVSPEPDTQKLLPGGARYEFAVGRAGDTEVTLGFRPQQLGRLTLTATVGGVTTTAHQIVLP